jgi:hypothetical protein
MFAVGTNGEMGDNLRRRRRIEYFFASYSTLQTGAERTFGMGTCMRFRQHKEPFHKAVSAMSGLATGRPRSSPPPERLFDPLAGAASRARIDQRATVGLVL